MDNKPTNWQAGREDELYAILARMVAAGTPGVLVTVIATERSTPRHLGAKMLVHVDGKVTGSIGGGRCEALAIEAAAEVLRSGECRRLRVVLTGDVGACGGELEVFLEPLGTAASFWVIGAGHVGRAILGLGRGLGFRFVAVDDRPNFLAGLEPVETLAAGPDELAAALTITPGTAILIASYSHELDAAYLDAVLAAEQRLGDEAAYLGVIGSRSKSVRIRKEIGSTPERAERLQRVRMPVGLAVGAETPSEIALSILAEVLAVLREVPAVVDDTGRPIGVYLHREVPR